MAYSSQIAKYRVQSMWTINYFIKYILENSYIAFNIANGDEIEIVESGQYNNINSRDPELAPPIELSNTTIEEKYGSRYTDVAFYIRRKNSQSDKVLSLIHPQDLLDYDSIDEDDDNIFNLTPSPY